VSSFIRTRLEHPIGLLESSFAKLVSWYPRDPDLQAALTRIGVDCREGFDVYAIAHGKWLAQTRGGVFILRDTAAGLSVSREVRPSLAALLRVMSGAAEYVRWALPAQVRRNRRMLGRVLHKRVFDWPTTLQVNVGAGPWYARGWKNLDHVGEWYTHHRWLIDYRHDLARPDRMPFADGSVQLFYSEHVFEHLPDELCRHAFAELFRSLAPGGGVRIVVPDADLLCERLKEGDEAFFRELMFGRPASLAEAFLILVAHPRERVDERQFAQDLVVLPRRQFLDKCKSGLRYDYARAGEHINWFNFEKLRDMLLQAGFQDVTLSEPQRSRFGVIRGRGFDSRPSYSLHVDAIKPAGRRAP
jgi:SAM-dependent methyltransferase